MSTKSVEKSVSKKSQNLDTSVELPQGVSAKYSDGSLLVSGPLGKVIQDFSKIAVDLEINDGNVKVVTHGARRENRAILNTAKSHLHNAVAGVTKGYQYKLKVIYAHFPVNIKIQGKRILVENFYGERSPRVAEIIGETKAEVQGEDIILNGVSIQDVGQTAANLEQATKVKRKDQRVFLDGVYIYERIRK
jgi:large subunit ribosomal protein L6